MIIDSGHTYIIALIFANILAWASFLSIIFFTNPRSAGIFGVIILYVSFIIGLIGLILILWQLINRKKN